MCDDIDACLGQGLGVGVCAVLHATLPRTDTTTQSGLPVSPGDLDGDGFDDVLYGDAATSAYRGEVRILGGSESGIDATDYTVLATPAGGGYFGLAIGAVGDVTGDGLGDVVVAGASGTTTTGTAWLFPGTATGLSAAPLSSVAGWYRSGETVAGLGDVNGDGYGDIAIGAPFADDTRAAGHGAVRVYHGSATGFADPPALTLQVATGGLFYGASVARAGDVDGDGYMDLLVGQPGTGAGGVVYLYPGSATGIVPAASWSVSATGGAFGLWVAGGADLDEDGATEVITANYFAATVYAYEVSEGALPTTPTWSYAGPAGSYFGVSLVRGGDVNADGYDDLVVGAYRSSTAYLLAGGPTVTLAATIPAPSGTGQFGALVSAVGDLNGDGAADISVGDTTTDDGYVYLGVCDDDEDLDGYCDNVDRAPGFDDRTDTDGDGAPDLDDPCPYDAADDADGDGTCGDVDNCPVANPDQADGDGDGAGDGCDPCPGDADDDGDADGVCADADNCPTLANNQADGDGDDIGDECDACPLDPDDDADGDGLCADLDNCPDVANVDQLDTDLDGQGDPCDNCLFGADDGSDADGICTDVDNCPDLANADQADADGDGTGDVCDPCPGDADDDADADSRCADVDDCPLAYDPEQADADGDTLGDACDPCPADTANDPDHDGACADVDCDDHHPGRAPGLEEHVGDGIDADCDGTEVCLADPDGDGWVDGAEVASADMDCTDAGEAEIWAPRGDCEPVDPTAYPGAPEVPGDEVDEDCDGAELCFADADLDGYTAGAVVESDDVYCDAVGEALAGSPSGDCDDTRATTAPGAPEGVGDSIDADCDGQEVCGVDADGDGWAGSTVLSADLDCDDAGEEDDATPPGDCDDTSDRVHPGAVDVEGDGQDRDCSGGDGDPRDDDGDGWAANLDCDDTSATRHPGAGEICNTLDDNCDGTIDEGVRALQFEDLDLDGSGTLALTLSACDGTVEGYASAPGDCDDADPGAAPGLGEVCDGIDNDCDGAIDEDPGLGCP